MDTFTSVFGGSPVQAAQVAYRAITLSQDTTLFWPQQSIDTTDILARINDVTATATGLNLILSSAMDISTGQDALINNIGANAFTVLANDRTPIANVPPGIAVYLWNTDNSTVGGSWRVTTFGAGSSQADAAGLAGLGMIAIASTLNLNLPVHPINGPYTVLPTDRATVLNWTGGSGTISLPAASSLGQGWFCEVRNSGSGAAAVATPVSGTIDGNPSKTYNQLESSFIHSDGINYYTVGYGQAVTSSFTRLVVNVAGGSNVTLTSTQAQNEVLEFTGALTANITVFVPPFVAEYFAYNGTTGAFTLTFATVGGGGVLLAQGQRRVTHCDGTNIVFSDTPGGGTVTAITAGTGLTGGTITTSGTLAVAPTGVTPGTYANSTITVDATGRISLAASGGNISGVRKYVSLTNLSTNPGPGDIGTLYHIQCTIAAGVQVTLPNVTVVGNGYWVDVRSAYTSTYPVTIVPVAGQTISWNPGPGASLALQPGQMVELQSDGAGGWNLRHPGTVRMINPALASYTVGDLLSVAAAGGGPGGPLMQPVRGVTATVPSGATLAIAGTLNATGAANFVNISASGNISTATINTSGNASLATALVNGYLYINYPTVNDFVFLRAGGARTLQFATGWYLQWLESGGTLQWVGGGGSPSAYFYVDGSGNGFFKGQVRANYAGANPIILYYDGGSGYYCQFAANYYLRLVATTSYDLGEGPTRAAAWQARTSDSSWIVYFGPCYATSFPIVSDERLKRDVSPSRYGLAEVLRIEPIRYTRTGESASVKETYREKAGMRDPNVDTVPLRPEIGFSAQQLQAVIPEAVTKFEDDEADSRLAINPQGIVAALVNALKEIDARLRALEAR